MNRSFDFDPVDRITAGALGDPGERVFYVQAHGSGEQITILAEKEQVALLAQACGRLLAALRERGEEGPPPDVVDLELQSPVDPEWRAGSISIEYDEEEDRVAIVINEAKADDDQDEPASARLVATRAQVRAMAVHALEIVAAGRPRCQFCGEPVAVEDEDHLCAAMNGHRKRDEE